MESEFKFLCITHQACPEVEKILLEMGFTNPKSLDKSPSYDMSAKFNLENEKEKESIAKKVFQRTHGRVVSIQITT